MIKKIYFCILIYKMDYNVKLQHFEKNDQINHNIYSRNIPSSSIQFNFSPRSVSTKYSLLPILDHKSEPTVPINEVNHYNSETVFFPSDRKPDFCGFGTKVDTESTLRNQFFALQKADQAKWIPNTNSDLYENNISFKTVNNDLDTSLLFNKEDFNKHNPNVSNKIGNNFFNNSTRVQLKNI